MKAINTRTTTKTGPIITERGENIPFSPELKALLERSETGTTTTPPKPVSQTPESVRFNLD